MTLTPLKVAYKKLRLLVDRGCIFIGHGLSKDFRIISESLSTSNAPFNSCHVDIYVPPEQVIDTVDLYFLKSRQRRLSLRFLSWFVLGEHIQRETHDSIEDARSALRLYNAFQAYEEQGIFDQKLDELYKEGRQYVCCQMASFDPVGTYVVHKYRTSNRQYYRTNKLVPRHPNTFPRPCQRNQPSTSATQLPTLTRTLHRCITLQIQWSTTPYTVHMPTVIGEGKI
jgi:PAB-dependent poly(A)-specific ribonuclease subunit 2